MDQSKLPDLLESEILKHLPDEAIDELATLSEQEGDHEAEIFALLKRYNIDLKYITEQLAKKEATHE